MAAVHNDNVLDSVGFFANIMHPIDYFQSFSFRVLEVTHNRGPPMEMATTDEAPKNAVATALDLEGKQVPDPVLISRRSTLAEKVSGLVSNASQPANRMGRGQLPPGEPQRVSRYAVAPAYHSPLHVLSVLSCLMTIGLIIAGVLWKDGTAVVAVSLLSLATSVIGYAAWWRPVLLQREGDRDTEFGSRTHASGDTIIRTRTGAIILIRCDKHIARELYSGTKECQYIVTGVRYRYVDDAVRHPPGELRVQNAGSCWCCLSGSKRRVLDDRPSPAPLFVGSKSLYHQRSDPGGR